MGKYARCATSIVLIRIHLAQSFCEASIVTRHSGSAVREKTLKRTYTAITEGKLKTKKGTIDSPIGRDRSHPTRRRVSPSGQTAVTHFKVVASNAKERLTLVELELETGRTHQIRVHMASIGHPLIGDALYGGGSKLLNRQALHAKRYKPFTR